MNLKRMLLSKRSTYYFIPFIGYFRRDKVINSVDRSVDTRGLGNEEVNR